MARFPLFGDTSPEDLKRFLELSRTLTSERRLEKLIFLNTLARASDWQRLFEEQPDATDDELRIEMTRRRYGQEWADRVAASLAETSKRQPLPFAEERRPAEGRPSRVAMPD